MRIHHGTPPNGEKVSVLVIMDNGDEMEEDVYNSIMKVSVLVIMDNGDEPGNKTPRSGVSKFQSLL